LRQGANRSTMDILPERGGVVKPIFTFFTVCADLPTDTKTPPS
jgi:hypothetical protein